MRAKIQYTRKLETKRYAMNVFDIRQTQGYEIMQVRMGTLLSPINLSVKSVHTRRVYTFHIKIDTK